MGVVFCGNAVSYFLTQRKEIKSKSAASTVRVETKVVNILAVVRDPKGNLVTDLDRDDFEIREDGVRQEIRYFSRETETPLTIGLLIDTSGSVVNFLEVEKNQAKLFLSRVLRPTDLAFVINFDLEVTLRQDFTNDMRDLSEAIDSVVINAGGAVPVYGPGNYPGGGQSPFPGRYPVPSTRPSSIPPTFPNKSPAGTLLYDAVYLAANEQLADEVGRKVLILLSDGQDQGSQTELSFAISSVQRANTVIYALPVSGQGVFGRMGGGSALKRLSRHTGGRVIKVRKARNMGDAFEEIAEELRSQYSLGYTPTTGGRAGFRKVDVRVTSAKSKVQARRGYYASPH